MRWLSIVGLGIAAAAVSCVRERGSAAGILCEVKVTLRPGEIADAMRELGLVDVASTRYTLWYFDTRELHLFENGVILRERRIAGEPDKSTVKLRGTDLSVPASEWLDVHGFKREEDRTGTKDVMSWALSATTEEGAIDAVVDGTRAIDVLFSGEQREFLADCSPIPIDWRDLVPLGPIEAESWTFKPRSRARAPARKLTAERWTLPDGTDLFEISTKARAQEADAAQAELLEFLESLDLDIADRQDTKTRIALEYFAK